jgi:rhamnose utilization protein RhaD (predicted bifunctional aldolase and dehydrogenase)
MIRDASGGETSTMAALLRDAVHLAHRFGGDPEFSRAGGGNVSAKADGVLHIKPSGVALASLTPDTLMPLRLDPLLSLLQAAYQDPSGEERAMTGSAAVMKVAMAARTRPAGEQRPSVEVLFHALLPQRFVLHTHPTLVNALCCATDGARIARRLFGDSVLWVPYVDPGLPLARAIADARRERKQVSGPAGTEVVLLQNHGLIVAADDSAEIEATSLHVVDVIRSELSARAPSGTGAGQAASGVAASGRRQLVDALSPLLAGLLSREQGCVIAFDGSPDAVAGATTAEGRDLVHGGPLTPDQIVYAGSWVLWLDSPPGADQPLLRQVVNAAVRRFHDEHGTVPTIVVIAGLGFFAAGETRQQAETAREIYLDALRIGFGALRLGGVRRLAPGERRFIEEWEAEAYRRGVAATSAAVQG